MVGTKNHPTTRAKTSKASARKGERFNPLDRGFYLPILGALGVLTLFILGIIFIPKLLSMPAPEPPTEDLTPYYELYDEVHNHNFAFGGDAKLENKVIKALNKNTTNSAGYFYYVMAAAEYYYNVRDYDRALGFIREAEDYYPNDETWMMIVSLYAKTYKKKGDDENYQYWQKIYDDYYAEPECDDEK